MEFFRTLVIGLTLMLLPVMLFADVVLKVSAMNYPAWVIRNHQTLALKPGYQLRTDDLIRTGKKGRVHLQLADDSVIKLGESARFLIRSADMTGDPGESLLQSSFRVLRGAFRFTSSFFRQADAGYRFDVTIGSITAEIRGTDIWGRSNLRQDLVALIEGEITVDVEGESLLSLEQPMSVYVKPKGEAALPVDQVDPDQLQRWVSETELDETQGIAAVNGEWSVVLLSLTELKNAERALKDFHDKGFAVRRKSVIRNGKTLHRLLLPGFVSIEDAIIARTEIAGYLGIKDAWIWRYF